MSRAALDASCLVTEFGVPLLKGDKESVGANLSFTEGVESDGDGVDSPLSKAAVLGPVCSRRVVQLAAPPGPKCRLRHLSNLLGAAAFATSPKLNIEEMQNKENERPLWSDTPRRENHSEPRLRCDSCDCIGD